jgi:hypothetical protein
MTKELLENLVMTVFQFSIHCISVCLNLTQRVKPVIRPSCIAKGGSTAPGGLRDVVVDDYSEAGVREAFCNGTEDIQGAEAFEIWVCGYEM